MVSRPSASEDALAGSGGPVATGSRVLLVFVCALMSPVFLVVPFIVAPLSNALAVFPIGIALIACALGGSFLWRPLVRRGAKEAQHEAASNWLVFTHGSQTHPAGGNAERIGPGWVLFHEHGLKLRYTTSIFALSRPSHTSTLNYEQLSAVLRVPPSATSYARLRIDEVSGRRLDLTLAPTNGSGLRGPSEDEVRRAVDFLTQKLRPTQ